MAKGGHVFAKRFFWHYNNNNNNSVIENEEWSKYTMQILVQLAGKLRQNGDQYSHNRIGSGNFAAKIASYTAKN
jgi:hypothetical protein